MATNSDFLWESIQDGKLLKLDYKNPEPRPKIAAYDIDNTIIVTR